MQSRTKSAVSPQTEEELFPSTRRRVGGVGQALVWASVLGLACLLGAGLSSGSPMLTGPAVAAARVQDEVEAAISVARRAAELRIPVAVEQRTNTGLEARLESLSSVPLSRSRDARFRDEVMGLMKEKNYPVAEVVAMDWLIYFPKSPDAHKLLGTIYAKQGLSKEGAREYRKFLKYAPADHPDYDKVKGILEAFDRLQ